MTSSFLKTLTERYNAYVSTFHCEGARAEMIRLKLVHTRRVVEAAEEIMEGERWPAAERLIGEAAALLHDVGRFTQLRDFGTFEDAKSVNHAERGVEVIRELGWLDTLPSAERALIVDAVACHNRKDVPERASAGQGFALRVCHLVRDADKLDIFRILEDAVRDGGLERDPEIVWGLPVHAPPSPEVVKAVCSGGSVGYSLIRSLSDFVLVQLAWLASGLHYATSRAIAAKRGVLAFRREFLKTLSDSPDIDLVCDAVARMAAAEPRVLFILSPALPENGARLRALIPAWAEVRAVPPGEDITVFTRGVLAEPCGADRSLRVVAAGGDGTVAAVAQALEGVEAELAVVPAGTGNLVARELGIPLNLRDAVAVAIDRNAPVRPLDTMTANGRLFLLNAGVGVNAETVAMTSRRGKTLFGRSAYAGAAVLNAIQSRPQPVAISVDGGGEETFEATDVLVSNCGSLARGLYPNGPDIRMDDGILDLAVCCLKTPAEYPLLYLKKRLSPDRENGILHERRAKVSVTIRSREPLPVQADGDIVGTTPVEIRIRPRSLRVVVQNV
ncbi:MAG: HD domain-containing protein [Kiritimatiellae bacterium]|nr:HD domain-containing protein [Kiritimatiellia bacterium]